MLDSAPVVSQPVLQSEGVWGGLGSGNLRISRELGRGAGV